jgi:hypothetical protein
MNKLLPTSVNTKSTHRKERWRWAAMGDNGASTSAKELQQMRGAREEERL